MSNSLDLSELFLGRLHDLKHISMSGVGQRGIQFHYKAFACSLPEGKEYDVYEEIWLNYSLRSKPKLSKEVKNRLSMLLRIAGGGNMLSYPIDNVDQLCKNQLTFQVESRQVELRYPIVQKIERFFVKEKSALPHPLGEFACESKTNKKRSGNPEAIEKINDTAPFNSEKKCTDSTNVESEMKQVKRLKKT